MTRSPALALAALALAALVGCSTSGSETDQPAAGIVTPTAAASGAPKATPVPEGTPVGALYTLATGDCFNTYQNYPDASGASVDLTTRVPCDQPHDAEVFVELTHPAAAGVPYPGRGELARWGTAECYARFHDFVGVDYELSALEIGVVVPEEPNWLAGPYRTAECYLWSRSGKLTGPMQGSNL